MTDREIAEAVPQYLPDSVTLRFGDQTATLPRNTLLYGKDFLSIRAIQQNFGRRPIAWSITAGGTWYGLNAFLSQQGLATRLLEQPVEPPSI